MASRGGTINNHVVLSEAALSRVNKWLHESTASMPSLHVQSSFPLDITEIEMREVAARVLINISNPFDSIAFHCINILVNLAVALAPGIAVQVRRRSFHTVIYFSFDWTFN